MPDFGLKEVSQKGGAGPDHSGPYPQKKHPEHPVKVLQDLHRVFQRQSRPQGETPAAAARARTKEQPNIFPNQTNFFRSKTKMTFKNQRFYFDADEASVLRMKALSAKSYFQQRDFQQLVNALITKAYENTNGKPIK